MRLFLPAFFIDALCVLAFAAIGRRSHSEGLTLLGTLDTAWPFLAGLAAAWAVLTLAKARPRTLVPAGLIVWPTTVAVGMVLRAVSGEGTATAFIVVATLFLGATLLGWRAVWLRSASAATPPRAGTAQPRPPQEWNSPRPR